MGGRHGGLTNILMSPVKSQRTKQESLRISLTATSEFLRILFVSGKSLLEYTFSELFSKFFKTQVIFISLLYKKSLQVTKDSNMADVF